MKKLLAVLAFVVVAVVAIVVARQLSPNGSPSTPLPVGGSGAGGGATGSRTSPQDRPSAASAAPASDSVGTVVTTMRGTAGSDRVSCDAIDTEFMLSPTGGRIRWTAQARDRFPDKPPFPGSGLAGVVLEPAAGMLDPGQRQLVHVRGSFDGPGRRFWVVVQAPNRSGSSWNSIELSCR